MGIPLGRLVEKRWLQVAVALFAVEAASYFLLMYLPMSASQVTSLSSQYSSITQPILSKPDVLDKAYLIFSHNLLIASIEFVPALGWAFFGYSTYQTVELLHAIALSPSFYGGSIPPQLVVLSLFLLPHTWLELPAYAIALTESLFVVRAALRRGLASELRRAAAVYAFVAGELLVAAVFESTEITYPAEALLTWLLALPLLGMVALAVKRGAAEPPQPALPADG